MYKLQDYKKVYHTVGGGLIIVGLYNVDTKDLKKIIVDDLEYHHGGGMIDSNYTIEELKLIANLSIDENALYQYNYDNGVICTGMTIEVVKGRKYKKGTKGTVIKRYPYYDKYGRWVADYILTDNGLRINVNNVKIV